MSAVLTYEDDEDTDAVNEDPESRDTSLFPGTVLPSRAMCRGVILLQGSGAE